MKLNGRKHSGMMMAEAVLALFVTMLTLVILTNVIQLVQKARDVDVSQRIRTHIVQEKLQAYLDGKEIYISPDNLTASFYVLDEKDEIHKKTMRYDKTLGDTYLRIKDNKGGFEPVVKTINIHFYQVGNLLKIRLLNYDHSVTEMFIDNVTFTDEDRDHPAEYPVDNDDSDVSHSLHESEISGKHPQLPTVGSEISATNQRSARG